MSKEALEVTVENLEDLLAYDDLFLDYFNSFLSLPVFPQALMYNRLTGAFNKVDGLYQDLSLSLSSKSPLYGPTDEERDNMLKWAQKERLPLFLGAQLFRELKLVKLLLRPLDNNNKSASRESSWVRGYSQATESYISSLSVSGDNNGNDIYDDDIWGEPHYSALFRYQRPGSRALSVPALLLLDSAATRLHKQQSHKKSNTSQKSEVDNLVQISDTKQMELDQSLQNKTGHPIRDKTATNKKHKARISNKVEVILTDSDKVVRGNSSLESKSKSSSKSRTSTSSTEDAFLRGARSLSAPVNYEHFLKMPDLNFSDFEALFGKAETIYAEQAYVQFEMEGISEEQTETDMKNLEGRLKMTIQQVKEKVLGSHFGFKKFCEFLQGTTGEHLLAFWLECEHFKDIMSDFDDTIITEMRNAYFRNMHDKFKLKLTSDALEQITKAANNIELSHTIFLRTQYDVLRRLRAYWVPRFLIHYEMTLNLSLSYVERSRSPSILPAIPIRSLGLTCASMNLPGKNHLPFFPSITLGHSVPLLPEDIKDYVNNSLFKFRYNDTDDVTDIFQHHQPTLSTSSSSSSSSSRKSSPKVHSKERFHLALSLDKLSGGPFKKYLARQEDPQLVVCLLFWEDVAEYRVEEDHLSDRLLRLCHAWNIYHRYLSDDSPHRIELSEKNRKRLQNSLQKARDFIKASVFENVKVHAVDKLEKAWIRYLKEDLKAFLDCQVTQEDMCAPSTADAIEITLTARNVIIKKPMPWVKRTASTKVARAKRLRKALRLAEEIDQERRPHKRSDTAKVKKEILGNGAATSAYSSQKETNWNEKSGKSELDKLDFELPERSETEKIPLYKDVAKNKQSKQIKSMFTKFVSDGENKDLSNKLKLYNDIESYFSCKDSNVRKAQASEISKSYLDSQGNKYLQLNNENLVTIIAEDKNQLKSGTLRLIQSTVLPEIEEVFQDFALRKAVELDVNPGALISMSKSALSRNINGISSRMNKRISRGKNNQLEMSQLNNSDQVQSLANSVALDNLRPTQQTNVDFDVNVPLSSRSKQKLSITSATSAHNDKDSSSTSSSPPPKATGRGQATREDKKEFLAALNQCATGQLTMPILYFYKYLLTYGPIDNMPQIDKDLFFYIEVQKFKDGCHNFADEEMLKRKLQSIIDCFLDSVYSPALQIDIPSDMHQKIMKTTQRYLSGKEIPPTLFDDPQFYVFKELLFFWAGFKKSISANDELGQKPVNKYDKLLQRRKEKIQNFETPNSEFILPAIPEGAVPSFNFSLSEGLKYKEAEIERTTSSSRTPSRPEHSAKQEHGRRSALLGLEINAKPTPESHHEALTTR